MRGQVKMSIMREDMGINFDQMSSKMTNPVMKGML